MNQRFGFPMAVTRRQAGFSLGIMDIMEGARITVMGIKRKVIAYLRKG